MTLKHLTMTLKHLPRGRQHLPAVIGRPGHAAALTARHTRRLATVPALLALTTLLQAGPALAASPRDGGATSATAGQHALGFVPDPHAPSSAALTRAAPLSLPSSVDLSQYDPPVGNQGAVGSCSAWSTGYYLRGWYAKRDGYYPGGGSGNTGSFEPMYTYAQLVHGQNIGSTFSQNLGIQQSQGIDTRADYTQGDYDYTDQPTGNEIANAAFFKIASYNTVSNGGGTSLQTWIESSLASGNPVAIGIPVYPEFDNVGPGTNYVVYPPKPGESSRGGHAVFAYKYDATGLWIKNSWGAGWGTSGDGDPNKGSAELSWSFVNGYGVDAANIVPQGAFTQLPGQLTGIAAGYVGYTSGSSEIWGLSSSDQIYNYNPSSGAFAQVPGLLAHISVGADGTVWGLNAAGQIYTYNHTSGSFTQVPGFLAQIAVGNALAVWGLNASGQIYSYNPNSGSFTQVPGVLSSLAVGADNAVWGLNSSGQIFRFNAKTGGFTQVPGVLAQIAVGNANEVWGLNAAGQIYNYNPNSGGFVQVPGRLASIAVAADGSATGAVWGLNAADQIYRFSPNTGGFTQVWGLLAHIAVGVDDSVWGLNASGQIYAHA